MSANVETSGFVGRALGNRWIVGDQLGSGSFGVVHGGVERGTGAPVAIKLLHPQFLHHGETIARFWNEAEALRRMNHPNVLVLLDVGMSDDGVPYLVTELLTGETLRDLLNREGPLPPERAMRLLGPAAHALHHAHMHGIVHRDLKPENIFRVRKDGMGTTKILDFGVAKLLDTGPGRKLSQTGIMIGTMAYSPPEQMQGLGDIDHRADQFGFGALIFEALTGQRPFPHTQPFALFQAVMSGPRPRASDVHPGIPKAVDEVLIRALDADRERRYTNVEEFYLAVSTALTQPNFPGLSKTFNGAPQHLLPSANSPLPPMRQTPQPMMAAPPPMMQGREPSNRFRPVDEEATRGDHLVATYEPAQPVASSPSFNTTLQSGNPASLGLVPASVPQSAPPPNQPPTLPSGASLGTALIEGGQPRRGEASPPRRRCPRSGRCSARSRASTRRASRAASRRSNDRAAFHPPPAPQTPAMASVPAPPIAPAPIASAPLASAPIASAAPPPANVPAAMVPAGLEPSRRPWWPYVAALLVIAAVVAALLWLRK